MSTLKIKKAFEARGISASEVETVKNGVVCKGYRINNGTTIMPVIYLGADETTEEFVERALDVANSPVPHINPDELVDREKLLKDSYLCIQKQSSENNIVKREFLNLEQYVRMNVDLDTTSTNASVKITKQILKESGLLEEELFNAARVNSVNVARISSFSETLGFPEGMFDDVPFYIGRYEGLSHGAAILSLHEKLHEHCKRFNLKSVIILPSSTEEVLILPNSSEKSSAYELAQIVDEVNRTTVDPIIQLVPTVYEYDDEINKVSIIYEMEV